MADALEHAECCSADRRCRPLSPSNLLIGGRGAELMRRPMDEAGIEEIGAVFGERRPRVAKELIQWRA
jgi:hypothetical protein